jgi:hypothetical protein
MSACQQWLEDSKKVPRVIMCDQLWMWVLDQSKRPSWLLRILPFTYYRHYFLLYKDP